MIHLFTAAVFFGLSGRCFLKTRRHWEQIQLGNWDFSKVPIVANGIKVMPKV